MKDWLEIVGYELEIDEFPDGSFRYTILDLPEADPLSFTIILKTTLPASIVALMQVCIAIIEVFPNTFIQLVVQTLPDQRADRAETRGMTVASAATIYLLGRLPVDKITVYDLHSVYCEENLRRACEYGKIELEIIDSLECFKQSLGQANLPIDFVVAVDKGAITRAGLAAEAFNCDIIYADKNRVDGTIIGHKIKSTSKTPEPSDNIWVIDDLCDGGATFISIAKLLRENYEFNQLNLYVTHGLFSKGKEELSKYYDNILSHFDYSETK